MTEYFFILKKHIIPSRQCTERAIINRRIVKLIGRNYKPNYSRALTKINPSLNISVAITKHPELAEI